jgi:hypothetical protein
MELSKSKSAFWLLVHFIVWNLVFMVGIQLQLCGSNTFNGMSLGNLLAFPMALAMLAVAGVGLPALLFVACIVWAIIRSNNIRAVLTGHIALIVYAIAAWVFVTNVKW